MSSASASSTHLNLWFLSGSTNQSSSQASASSQASSYTSNITVAFRATLVTVDRAGWFQPQFFKQSGTFYHIDPTVSWSKWPADARNDMTTLRTLPQRSLDSMNKQSLLPAFPVGYIICKDITIKISSTSASTAEFKSNMRKDAAASGGVLCFSFSQSSSSSQSDNSYSFQTCSDGCVVRIPGPQILGYIMQLTDNDTTKDMPNKLPDDFFIPDADYDAATAGIGEGPAFALNRPRNDADGSDGSQPIAPFFREIDEILRRAKVPASAVDGVHEAMQKELDALSDEVANRVRMG